MAEPTPRPHPILLTVIGVLLATALSLAGWTARELLALKEEQLVLKTETKAELRAQAQAAAELKTRVDGLPVRVEIENLSKEIAGLRVEMKEYRDDLRNRRAR